MKHRRGVPSMTPETMARQLSVAYWKPAYIARDNLKLAKTNYQIKFWQRVVELCPEQHT